MNNDQIEKFLGVQIAQLAMLQSIASNLHLLAAAHGGTRQGVMPNWKDVEVAANNGYAVAQKAK